MKIHKFIVLSKYQFGEEVEVHCARSLDNCPHTKFKHGDGFCDDDMNNLGTISDFNRLN